MHKDVTIYDIAAALNVSPSTVSRALKNHHSIGKKTIRAVKKMALERGYTTNTIASGLRNKKSRNIGVVIPWISSPFYSSLISGIELELNERGYNLMILQSCDSYQKELTNIQTLYQNRVCGLIISPCSQPDHYDHLTKFIENEIPIVLVDNIIPEVDSYSIMIDHFQAGYAATSHLISQGCRRIAMSGGKPGSYIFSERERGYRAALAEAHLSVDEGFILHNKEFTHCQGHKNAERLFKRAIIPDGIVAATDSLAVGIMQYAKQANISIPHELGITGFNNDLISRIIEPALTTFNVPVVEMGIAAAHKIFSPNKTQTTSRLERTVFETQIIIRESSDKAFVYSNP